MKEKRYIWRNHLVINARCGGITMIQEIAFPEVPRIREMTAAGGKAVVLVICLA